MCCFVFTHTHRYFTYVLVLQLWLFGRPVLCVLLLLPIVGQLVLLLLLPIEGRLVADFRIVLVC
jgi:hypothetical protein